MKLRNDDSFTIDQCDCEQLEWLCVCYGDFVMSLFIPPGLAAGRNDNFCQLPDVTEQDVQNWILEQDPLAALDKAEQCWPGIT